MTNIKYKLFALAIPFIAAMPSTAKASSITIAHSLNKNTDLFFSYDLVDTHRNYSHTYSKVQKNKVVFIKAPKAKNYVVINKYKTAPVYAHYYEDHDHVRKHRKERRHKHYHWHDDGKWHKHRHQHNYEHRH
ncbi:MAG: hypothetical protein GY804_12800 [Alphaproteobacteria bacterium]|nr:hypothetical protein [Alphaproteobacteria bacterium]